MEEQKYFDGQTLEVSIEDIDLDENQPRKTIHEEALNTLAKSIKRDGVIQNIVVRPLDSGRFKIVAGERRFRAFQKLREEDREKWSRINVVIRLVDDKDALNLALIENIVREDLLPIERARAVVEYKARKGFKTDKELAKELDMSKSNLSNLLKLLDLDDYIQQEISGVNGRNYAYRDLIRIARLKDDARRRAFNELKAKATGETQEKIAYTDAEKALNSRRLFARTAAETESLCSEKVEFFEAHKYNAARAVLNALKCIDRLSEVKDLPADLKQASSIDDLKNALQEIVDAEPQPEQKPEPEKKRKGAPRRVKKTDKMKKTDK